MDYLLFHIIYTSITLALLFGGYSMVSEYMTIVYGRIGFYVYFVIYISNVIGSFISPFLALVIGVKWSIFVGALTYFAWMFVFNFKLPGLLLSLSVLNGIGSAIMRSQQSVWITSLPVQDKLGYYLGVYNAAFNFNGIFAAIISIIVLFLEFKLESLIWLFVGIGLLSMVLLFFIKSVPITKEHFIDRHSLVVLLRDKVFLLLYPIIIFQSVSMIFTYGVLPTFMEGNDLAVAIMFLVYSLVSAIVAYIVGILCDRVKLKNLVIIVAVNSCMSTAYIYGVSLLLHGRNPIDQYHIAFAYIVVGVFCAINDSATNSILMYILSKYYDNRAVFSIHRAVYSIFCAIYAGIAPFISKYINVIICNPLIIVGLYTFIIYEKKIKDKTTNNPPIDNPINDVVHPPVELE